MRRGLYNVFWKEINMQTSDQFKERHARYVDTRSGTVKREIFVDEEIYKQEKSRIFGRCWLYLVHESEIPNPGDFVSVYMGEEPVVVCRDPDGKIGAFINSCRHRGNRICRVDRGNTKTFVCSYHGWAYSTRGNLVGVPGKKEYYQNCIDQDQLGLIKVAQVSSYGGLVFGTLDPEATSLDEYLGDMRWGLDIMLGQGNLVAVPGVMRWAVGGNWKFSSDNAVGDMYHAAWTHRSAMLAAHQGGNGAQMVDKYISNRRLPGLTLITEYGHGLTADYMDDSEIDWSSPLAQWRRNPKVKERLGPVRSKIMRSNMNVFPNLFVNSGSRDLMLHNPRGPNKMEFWKTTLVDRDVAPEVQRLQVRSSNRHLGPAGMFEQDDGENFEQSTDGARGLLAPKYDLHYAMGLGRERFTTQDGSPPFIDDLVNEHAQLWLYKCWAEHMDAENWTELRAKHSKPQDGI